MQKKQQVKIENEYVALAKRISKNSKRLKVYLPSNDNIFIKHHYSLKLHHLIFLIILAAIHLGYQYVYHHQIQITNYVNQHQLQ